MGAWEDGFAAGYDRGLMQGAMGRKPKALKKKHPRTSFRVLVKKAHRQAKRG